MSQRAPLFASRGASERLRVGVLCSGSGSNLQALLDASQAPGCPFVVVVVVVNVEGAFAAERARAAGVPVSLVPHKGLARDVHEDAVAAALAGHDVDVVVLAGYMRVLTAGFVRRYPKKIINVHPALLPSFPGTHGARQALLHGCRVTGCTVHLVDDGVDTGPILLQAAVPILVDDDEAALQRRIQVEEHKLLPAAVRAYAEGRVVVVDGRVVVVDG